jgi:hypothetical protein
MLRSSIVKRLLIALVVVVVGLCAGVGAYGRVRRHHREAALERALERRRAARTPLQKAAWDIDYARRDGYVHFFMMPKTMPPGLLLLQPIGEVATDGVTDVYSYGQLQAMVRYTVDHGKDPCGRQTCVRDGETGFEDPEAPSLHYMAIWLAGKASSAEQEAQVRRFWTTTTWVPTAEAKWFTKLAWEGNPG